MNRTRSTERRSTLRIAVLAPIVGVACLGSAIPALAQEAVHHPGPAITIQRAAGPIQLDGNLDDAGWKGITPITEWYETNIGDNVTPQVGSAAYLAYDENYLYAAFRFSDPDPKSIRAPIGDHDAVNSSTDYGGLIVDAKNDGKTAQMFLANPRGVQYDAISSDVSGEDNAPDFYWDSVGRITADGWVLEMRVPFSSLRYAPTANPTWGLLMYRNYPRDRRYQFFSARLPRDVNCFICNSSALEGLVDLPHGSNLVLAPFATGQRKAEPDPALGSPLRAADDFDSEYGADLKWSPNASLTIDGTVNPDFSQVESDQSQIAANERFALAFPEKRPFFLEGIDLFSTPMRAVYTRTVTQPKGGMRITGRSGATSYMALGAHDRGGGIVVLPGPQGSGGGLQDFESDVGIFRVRRDFGRSYGSALLSARELPDGRYNRVFGPDFQWRYKNAETLTGQALWSESSTPNRPDLGVDEWDGRHLDGHALQLAWSHGTRTVDWYLQGQDLSDGFRADNGFIPQVGYREMYGEAGYTVRPKDRFFSRIRFFTANWVDAEPDGDVLSTRWSVGSGMDGKLNSFFRVELNNDRIRVGDRLLDRFRPHLNLTAVPGRVFNSMDITVDLGQDIDFANAREGHGMNIVGGVTLRPSDHLELREDTQRRWLNVDDPARGSGRLFLAAVDRLRATWSFNSRSFVRLIGEYRLTRRSLDLYLDPSRYESKEAEFAGSALFAYKLNWQTVVYLGYGDGREYLATTDRLEKSSQQAFAKLSYAWQR